MKMREAIEADPANAGEGIYLHSAKARKKIDAINLQIAHNTAVKRAAEGRPVAVDGYSGRKSKRRR